MYQIQRLVIHWQIETKLHQTNLQTLVLSWTEYESSRVDKAEIIVQNRYFDISKVEKIAEGVKITGMWDDEESDIIKNLKSGINMDFVKKILKLFPLLLSPFTPYEPNVLNFFLFFKPVLKSTFNLQELEGRSYVADDLRPPIF